ncbi:MAG: flagellar filament capping protein FliD [Thermoguttaceae bacterium]
MGTIQSGVGLISGLNIGDIVDQLMAISAKPRDALKTRNDNFKKIQTALKELAAQLYSVKYLSDNLGKDGLYSKVTATSSDTSILTVQTTGTPAVGTHVYTPLQKAQHQQLLSGGLYSSDDLLGDGKISFRFGDTVQHTTDLISLNGGDGFTRGKILITDRSGAKAEIDLTAVQNLDDVVDAINNNTSIDVTADLAGDGIRLTDDTGQTLSNLKVAEVNGGSTAASLGLAGINQASNTAIGSDIVYLAADLDLSALNDGMGVGANAILPDIQYTLSDGTTGEIDLSEINGSTVTKEYTLGDIMDKINAAAPGKLKLEIAADGKRFELTDLTTGTETFEVTAINNSQALKDLGLTGTASGGVITGSRIISGTKTVLISSLGGGSGLGSLGSISLTDRTGTSDTVDLSNAETLQDVIQTINSAAVQITAGVNPAGNGIVLTDTSGSTSGNLIVANNDETNSADKLQIAVDDAINTVNSGDLHLQVIGLNTKLSDLNGGAGVTRGKFKITDSKGNETTINLYDQGIQTVGDLLQNINALAENVLAELNDTGDGIVLSDSSGGIGTLKVEDEDSTAAHDLNLLGNAKTIDGGGGSTQVIDGSMTRTINLDVDPKVITLDTNLSDLNGGLGVAKGKFKITNTIGESDIVDLTGSNIQTVGDLIGIINALSINVTASINDSQDGIKIRDVNEGEGHLSVTEQGSTTAKDLFLLGKAKTTEEGDVQVQTIDGQPQPYSLEMLRDKINQMDFGMTASIVNDGSNKPYHLLLVSKQSGKAGEVLLDASQAGFAFDEIASGKDALLAVGSEGTNLYVSSSTNSFTKVLEGATLTIQNASSQSVTVTVTASNTDITASVKTLVENYNKFRETLSDDTAYDVETNTASVLTGDNTALQMDLEMQGLISGLYLGSSSSTIKSLYQIGISMKDDGTLSLDEAKLNKALAENRNAVKQLFSAEDNGVSDRFAQVIERLAGTGSSLFETRYQALQNTIDHNQKRIDTLDAQLDKQTNRLLNQFYNMEQALAKLQSNLSALDSIQWMLTSNKSNSLFNVN